MDGRITGKQKEGPNSPDIVTLAEEVCNGNKRTKTMGLGSNVVPWEYGNAPSTFGLTTASRLADREQ